MRLHCEHKTAVFLTLSRQTRQIMAKRDKSGRECDKTRRNSRLLKVVFTKECSRGEKSPSGRTEDAEVRRPIGEILPTSLGEAEIGVSGMSS